MIKFNEINAETTGTFDFIALISKLETKLTTKGSDYFQMELSTKEGILPAKYWNVKLDDKKTYKPGKVIQGEGAVDNYGGNVSIVIKNMSILDLDPSEFTLTALDPVAELEKEFNSYAYSIKNTQLADVVTALINEDLFKENFYIWPAAKSHHHAERHGLLMHTTRMLRTADAICREYNKYSQVVNRDLVIAGVIFHDWGKLKEMSMNDAGSGEYTKEGILLGHLYLGAEKVHDYEKEGLIDYETAIQLKHIIASHHGKLEFGAIRDPHTVEADIVHFVDDMDAKVFERQTNDLRIKPGEFDSNWTYNPLPIE